MSWNASSGARVALRVGVLLLVVGMALWILGVLVPGVLLAGIYLAAFSLVVLAAAGVALAFVPAADEAVEAEEGQ